VGDFGAKVEICPSARLLSLETEMARIGKEWVSFGSALQNPKNYTFDVTTPSLPLEGQQRWLSSQPCMP